MRETIWLKNMFPFKEGVTVRQMSSGHLSNAIGGEAPMEVSEGAEATEPNLFDNVCSGGV